MYIHFITFGCKVNVYDTAYMSARFEQEGFTVTADESAADIFVINSCTVTAESDSKLGQCIRRLRRLYPNAAVVLTGCFPQAFPEKAEKLGADVITGTKDRSSVTALTMSFLEGRERIASVKPYLPREPFEKMSVSALEGHTRAFLKIQDGCSSGCSYCAIPRARGPMRSKGVEDIISEARALAENGYREIVLTGINLAFWGAERGMSLADAAEAVCSAEGIERLRLGSLEPERITDSDLERFAALPQFCPSFHLSLQSGCDRILAAMNRRYISREYEELVSRIRSIFPLCGITADVMTGFPTETEEDHRQSLEFVRSIGFSDIHVFPYSPREGTKAAAMDGQVPADIKKRRAREMSEAGAAARREYLRGTVGKTLPVLFERERADGVHHGYTPDYVHVKILTKYSEKSLRKKIFYVKIDKMSDECCYGHIVTDRQQ